MFSALQDAVTFIHNLKEDNISVEEMRFNLIKMGVSLNEEEFQDVLKKAGMTGESLFMLSYWPLGYFDNDTNFSFRILNF